jgi:putative membrane protein insertion efficiency factor
MAKSVEYSQESATPDNRVSLLAYPLIIAIYIYRYTLSPIFGNSCRFYPTCSHYAQDALRKYGALKGTWLAVKRIGRCHPWHEGGFDPVE